MRKRDKSIHELKDSEYAIFEKDMFAVDNDF
jgi:hypothetical protein